MYNEKKVYLIKGPVTAIIILVLLVGNVFFYLRDNSIRKDDAPAFAALHHDVFPVRPKPEPVETPDPEFTTGERAVFKFTKDTVLVLAPADLIDTSPAWNVLYKDKNGIYQNEAIPENMLDKIDSVTRLVLPVQK